MNVNCMSHIAIINALLPKMIQRKSGHIVNVLSLAAVFGITYRTLYSAPKFGTDGFGKALAPEVKQHGIAVTQVYPGYVQTEISKNARDGKGGAFGKTDDNIKNGMSVEKAVDWIIRSMYLKREECYVCSVFYMIFPKVAFLSSSLTYMLSQFEYKRQTKVIEDAKN